MANIEKWSTPVRPIFRVLSFFLGIVFVLFGVLSAWELFTVENFVFDTLYLAGLSASVFGIAMLVIALRGSLLRRRHR